MRELLPHGRPITLSQLPDVYDCADCPQWQVRLNFVSTVDGSVVGSDGRSGSINNEVDGAVFQMLRAWADVVVAGANTVRVEGYDAPVTDERWTALRAGRPDNPALAVLARSGELPADVDTGGRSDVFALDSGGTGGVRRAFDRLRERGYQRVLCEGGPTIAALALAAGVVDEVCLTTSPTLVGGSAHRMVNGPSFDRPARLVALLEADSMLLARWDLRQGTS